jgi:hypothetical protein
MADEQDLAGAHKRFAVDCYNAAWELLERADRTPEEDRRMLSAAFASRHHWDALGRPEQTCVGDWMVANVASRLGFAGVALTYARAAVDAAEANDGFADYVLASCYEGMARAFACAGDDAERDRFVEACKGALARIAEDDDRAVIEDQLRSVPGYR